MATKISMIKNATKHNIEQTRISENVNTNLNIIAEQKGITYQALVENVTHVLANIATDAEQGNLIKIMHLNSIADFLAGVEAIADALPLTTDEKQRQNTLRILAAAAIGSDQHINDAVTLIVKLGARKQNLHDKYAKIVYDYTGGAIHGKANSRQILATVRSLQSMIDQAVRLATHSSLQNTQVAVGAARPGSSPANL